MKEGLWAGPGQHCGISLLCEDESRNSDSGDWGGVWKPWWFSVGCSLNAILYLLTAQSNFHATVSVWNLKFSVFRTEEAAVLLGSVLICILNTPSLVEFGEQNQRTNKIASICCSDGGTKHRKPRICFTWQIHQNYKAFFKNYDF